MIEDDEIKDTMFCFSCGVQEPKYTVSGHLRKCAECKSKSVMTVMEMIDLINDLKLKDLLPEAYLAEYSTEDFSLFSLDLEEEQQAVERAFKDARSDYVEEYYND
tara:strand:+ start:539 stop:853 length:315 start_codon:yes stop_codon:yes gene_type:complete